MQKTELNILIVEDDKTLREALSEAVKRKGYRAVPVGKPDEAESVVKIKPVHGLIVDCMLPGRNGVDLIERLRESLPEGAPAVLTSGIYRDKAYAVDALKKSGALEFFLKPFNIDKVLAVLEKEFAVFMSAPKVDLHALLASPFASQRDRRKALDHVEEMCGFDLPFVFCILMDSDFSGHLNIVDADQNIYGVTFAKGHIMRVDSEGTAAVMKAALLKHGFITESDLLEIGGKAKSSDICKALVEQGLMSPHAESVIRLETLVSEIQKIVNEKPIKVNYVPDRKVKSGEGGINVQGFLPQLHDLVANALTVGWLKNFYKTWGGHPIRLGPQFSDMPMMANYSLVKSSDALIPFFKKEATIDEILRDCKLNEEAIYRAIHFFAIRRLIVFDENRRELNSEEHVARIRQLHKELVGKNPVDIFKYFGLGDNPKPIDVLRIYKEFAKSNHPDTLPQGVPDEIKKLNHELFSAVTSANEVMSNEQKRTEYFNSVKQEQAVEQLKSEELVSAAAFILARGRYSEALPILELAERTYSTDQSKLHYFWVKLKIDGATKPEELASMEAELAKMPSSTKKMALYIFVQGLIKKLDGNYKGAQDAFNKALEIQENFMDARRELANLKGEALKRNEKSGILTGDLSSVLKNVFKKKGA